MMNTRSSSLSLRNGEPCALKNILNLPEEGFRETDPSGHRTGWIDCRVVWRGPAPPAGCGCMR